MICSICGEHIAPEEGYYEVESEYVCIDCAYSMSGARLLEELGYSEQGVA